MWMDISEYHYEDIYVLVYAKQTCYVCAERSCPARQHGPPYPTLTTGGEFV